MIAIADQGRALNQLPALSSTQTLSALYSKQSDFHDITQGSTGMYTIVNVRGQVIGRIPIVARPGYDMVTGLGTPIANLLIPALASVSTASSQTLGSSGTRPSILSSGHVPSLVSGPFDLPAQIAVIGVAADDGSTADAAQLPPSTDETLATPAAGTATSPVGVLPFESVGTQAQQSFGSAIEDLSNGSDGDANLYASPAVPLDSSPLPDM